MLIRPARVLIASTLLVFLSSCGGNGGGSNPPVPPPPPPPPDPVLVTGIVAAPNGQIAREWPLQGIDKWLAVILPEAVASVPGASPVPDGTPVELHRLSADGSSGEPLASTTTTGGSSMRLSAERQIGVFFHDRGRAPMSFHRCRSTDAGHPPLGKISTPAGVWRGSSRL